MWSTGYRGIWHLVETKINEFGKLEAVTATCGALVAGHAVETKPTSREMGGMLTPRVCRACRKAKS